MLSSCCVGSCFLVPSENWLVCFKSSFDLQAPPYLPNEVLCLSKSVWISVACNRRSLTLLMATEIGHGAVCSGDMKKL